MIMFSNINNICIVLLVTLMFAPIGCVKQNNDFMNDESLKLLYESLDNDNIIWDHNYAGMMPISILGNYKKWEKDSKLYSNELLLKALFDKNKWIAAHVMLTIKLMEKESIPLDGSHWNGLKVRLLGGGAVIIDKDQRVKIQKYWVEKLKKGGDVLK